MSTCRAGGSRSKRPLFAADSNGCDGSSWPLAGWFQSHSRQGLKSLLTRQLTLCYNVSMENKSTHVRVSFDTRRMLKIAAAMQDLTIDELVRRLAVAELERVKALPIDTPSL